MVTGPAVSSSERINVLFSGAGRYDWMERVTTVGFGQSDIAATAITTTAAAAIQTRDSRLLRRDATSDGTPACDPPSAIHFSWSIRSWTLWKRSSGSLARQFRMTRSSAGGDMGCTAETGGGSEARIAATTLD